MKYLFLTLLILSPAVVSAQNYLVGIPGIGDPSGDFDGYLQAIYVMFISIAALLAVVKIVIAGVKYMLTDIAPQKTSAKQDIQGALVGLLVVLSAVLILTVINPDLTNFDFNANRVATPEATEDNRVTFTPPSQELGFTFVPNTLNEQQRINFILACAGRVTIIGDQTRCYELDEELTESIINDLSNAPNAATNDEIQDVLDQARDFLSDRFISNTTEIAEELEVAEVFFAVNVLLDEDIIITQAAGICEEYANANGEEWEDGVSRNGAGSNIQLVTTDNTQNYAACVRID